MLRRSSLVECVSVLPGNRCLQNVEFFFLRQYVQPCLLKNPKYTFYTIKSSLKLAYKTQFKEIKRGWASKGMTSTRWSFVPRPMTIILLGNNHFLIGRGCGWDFHCACNFFFWTFLSQNIFFSWRQQTIVFFSCGIKIHFSVKTIHWLLKFSSAIFFFLTGDRDSKSKLFLEYLFKI